MRYSLLSMLVLYIIITAVPILAQLNVGDKAKNFTLGDIQGRTISLSEQTNAGKIVVLFFMGCT